MATPLYSKIREASSTLYVFPGAVEDFSAANQQPFYTVRPSHFALIRIPSWTEWRSRVQDGTVFDETSKVFPSDLRDGFVDILRSYVANRETVRRETVDNNGKYTYQPGSLQTLAEKNMMKMLHRLGLLQLEIADKNVHAVDWDLDESLANPSFPTNAAPPDHFNQQLWKERSSEPVEVRTVRLIAIPIGAKPPDGGTAADYVWFDVEFGSQTRFRRGDRLGIRNATNVSFVPPEDQNGRFYYIDKYKRDPADLGNIAVQDELVSRWVRVAVLRTAIEPADLASLEAVEPNPSVVYDAVVLPPANPNRPIEAALVYEPVFKYVGEIQVTSSVQEANRAFTLSTGLVPETAGRSPDILFQTYDDVNYRPGDNWPNESQVQEEILGAEQSESPINIFPENYPGDEKALFDKLAGQTSFAGKYVTPDGDGVRRSGKYYGNIIPEGSQFDDAFVLDYESYPQDELDGIGIDFDLAHYHKAVTQSQAVESWDVFNQTDINGERPRPFEFNAVLWYYEVSYDNGAEVERATNLYGITLLGDPQDDGFGLPEDPNMFPVEKKLVSRGNSQGTAFILQRNTAFNFNSDNAPLPYSDLSSQEAFNLDAYQEVLQVLYQTNDLFQTLTAETLAAQAASDAGAANWQSLAASQSVLRNQVDRMNQQLQQVQNLNIRNTGTVQLRKLKSLGVTVTELHNVSPSYGVVYNMLMSTLGSDRQGVVALPDGLTTLVNLTNDDASSIVHSTTGYALLLSDNVRVGQRVVLRMTADPQNGKEPRRVLVYAQDLLVAEAWCPGIDDFDDARYYGTGPRGVHLLSTGYNYASGNHVVTTSQADAALLQDRFAVPNWAYVVGQYRAKGVWYPFEEMMRVTSVGTNDVTLEELRPSIGAVHSGIDRLAGMLYWPSEVELVLTRIRPRPDGQSEISENWSVDKTWK